MFVGAGLLLLFIFGLPVSFLIGAFIGYVVWRFRVKNRKAVKKQKYIIVGGISYIIAQPISVLGIIILPIQKLDTLLGYLIPFEGFSFFEMIFAVIFAIIFTAITTIVMSNMKLQKEK